MRKRFERGERWRNRGRGEVVEGKKKEEKEGIIEGRSRRGEGGVHRNRDDRGKKKKEWEKEGKIIREGYCQIRIDTQIR